MSDKQETIADILAEMRETKYGNTECEVKWCLTRWADRLETAHGRESATAEKSSVVGNGAKMREALLKIVEVLEPFVRYAPSDIYGIAKAALAAPARNCDRFMRLEDALAAWREVSPAESGPFDEWLFAEVKGEVK